MLPNTTKPFNTTRHHSCQDGVLVMPIEGRGRHLDPKQVPPKDRDIHLVEFKLCSDITPQQTLKKAHNNINLLSSVYEQGASEASLETTKSHFMLYFLESGAQSTISTP